MTPEGVSTGARCICMVRGWAYSVGAATLTDVTKDRRFRGGRGSRVLEEGDDSPPPLVVTVQFVCRPTGMLIRPIRRRGSVSK